MIVRSLGSTLRQLLTRNYVRLVTPVLRIYIRTFVSSRHKYSQGYIHVVKKDMQYITPVAFRYVNYSVYPLFDGGGVKFRIMVRLLKLSGDYTV